MFHALAARLRCGDVEKTLKKLFERRLNMALWTKDRPCVTCGATGSELVRCTNCGTLGCYKCVGSPGKVVWCKVCRKNTEIKRV